MSDKTPTELRLNTLDQHIEQLGSDASRTRSNRAPLESEASAARWQLSRLKFKRWLRTPAQSYELWKSGVLIIGSTAVGAICLIAIDIHHYLAVPFLGSGIGAACTAALLYHFLYHPSDAHLVDRVVNAEINSRVADARLRNLQATDGLAGIEQQLQKLFEERRQLLRQLRYEIASGMQRRTVLLQRNWKSMRDDEWEDYLVEVFLALGAKAHRIGCTGDQGVDI